MKERSYEFRGKMLRLFLERDFSPMAKIEISHLFRNMKDEEKEKFAKKIFPLIEKSEIEQEAVARVKQFVNRNK